MRHPNRVMHNYRCTKPLPSAFLQNTRQIALSASRFQAVLTTANLAIRVLVHVQCTATMIPMKLFL